MAAIAIKPAAVRPFRKSLLIGLRNNLYTLRVYGSKGAWFLGVQRGNTIIPLNPKNPSATQTAANLLAQSKYGIKPKLYRQAA